MGQGEMVEEMCRRAGLPKRTGLKILGFALIAAVRAGHTNKDMVKVAQAISYAGKNKHLLKEEWR